MINGLINVYKEKGFTSFDVVAVMRGISGQKKVGHTGTLDPDAEGVLPVCLGNATKLCDVLNDKRKEYIATLMLGKRTDTLDISGTVLEEREICSTREAFEMAAASFIGGYDQLPPMYSAKKVDGKRLYDLARQGVEVKRKKAFVNIYEIEILKFELPYVEMRVLCGKGTYIRSLCEDIAAKCGDLAVMTKLIRSRVDNFCIDNAKKLSELTDIKNSGNLLDYVIPTEFCFKNLPAVMVKPEFKKLIDNGNKMGFDMVLILEEAKGKTVRELFENGQPRLVDNHAGSLKNGETVRMVNCEGSFVGIFSVDGNVFKPDKMFPEG